MVKKVPELKDGKVTFRIVKRNFRTPRRMETKWVKFPEYSLRKAKADESRERIEHTELQKKFTLVNQKHILKCYHNLLSRRTKEIEVYRESVKQWIYLAVFNKLAKHLYFLIQVPFLVNL